MVLPIMCYVKQVDEQKEDFAMQQRYVDLLIDALLDEGFTVDEARRLILLQEEY